MDHLSGQQHSNIREQEVSIHRLSSDRGVGGGGLGGWRCKRPLPYIRHMRRSSLGNGRGRPGFSDPAAPVCFLSSALGLYVPSILLFFLMTHSSSSRAKLSRDSTVHTNTDTAGGINTWIAMVTDSWGGNHTHIHTHTEGSVNVEQNHWCLHAACQIKTLWYFGRDIWRNFQQVSQTEWCNFLLLNIGEMDVQLVHFKLKAQATVFESMHSGSTECVYTWVNKWTCIENNASNMD